MKYSIKVNEVRAKEGSNIKGFATVVFGDSFKIREAMDRAMIMQLNLLPVARKMVLEELEMKQNG